MIFERSLRRELAQNSAGIFIALFAILVATQLLRLLNDASSGEIPADALFVLLAFTALQYLPTVLVLTTFVAILVTLSRHYRDSEMVIWFASGRSLLAWLKPVLVFAVPVMAVVAALVFEISPWALRQGDAYRDKANARPITSQVSSGNFRVLDGGSRAIFVEQVNQEEGAFRNVFASIELKQGLGVVVARSGQQVVNENGERFLQLTDGRRYEIQPGQAAHREVSFDRYSIYMGDVPTTRSEQRNARKRGMQELWSGERRAADTAELVWRISLPLSGVILCVLAIPLAYSNPRAPKAFGYILAMLVFLIYNNLLTVSQSWIALGKAPVPVAAGAVHLVAVALCVLFMTQRIRVHGLSLRRWRQG